MGKLRVGERLSLADGSFATVTSISFELSPRTTGRWKQGQACTGTFGTKADAETGLFVVYNLIVADWHTFFAAHQGLAAYVHNGGPCLKEFEIGTMGELSGRSTGGARLSRHELLQHGILKAQDKAVTRGVGKASRDNPAIVLSNDMHAVVNALQRERGLHNPSVLAQMSAKRNIYRNAAILRKAGVSKELVAQLRKEALAHAEQIQCR